MRRFAGLGSGAGVVLRCAARCAGGSAGCRGRLGRQRVGERGERDEPKSLPQDGLFSSIKQNLREGDQEIIRGHFELGSPPNVHRYYCLMDPKTQPARAQWRGRRSHPAARRHDGDQDQRGFPLSLRQSRAARNADHVRIHGARAPLGDRRQPCPRPPRSRQPPRRRRPRRRHHPLRWLRKVRRRSSRRRRHPPQSAPSRLARSTFPASNSACLPTKSRRCSNPRICANATNGART